MNTAAKLLAAMRRNPLDIREDGRTLPVPAHRPIKPVYVRKFIELLEGA